MRLAIVTFACAFVLCGCVSTSAPVRPDGPPPEYASLRDQHNERVAGLDRLWARAVIALRYIDEDGERRREQGEGHFQYRRHTDLAVTIGKLGETYFHAGSNDQRYWWIDLSGEVNTAWVGRRDQEDSEAARRLGTPVQPTYVVDLAAMRAWPEVTVGAPAWSETVPGTVRFEFERDGKRVAVHADSFSGEAARIELLGRDGEVLAWSELDEYAAAPLRGGGRLPSRIPTKLTLVSPETDSEIDIWLSQPRIDPKKPNPRVFDLDTLLDAYRIERIVDVDEQR